MPLFKPFWMADNPNKYETIVIKIDSLFKDNKLDENKLIDIALNAPLLQVKKEAVKKLTNQMFLAKVAMEAIGSDVRKWCLRNNHGSCQSH